MFGLTQDEIDNLRELTEDFVMIELAPSVVEMSKYLTPVTLVDGKQVPDMEYVGGIIGDIETILLLTANNITHDYAYLQSDEKSSEEEILEKLHAKYEHFLMTQFIKYAVAISADTAEDIVGDLIIELPYLYSAAIEDANFDTDSFLQERFDAYDKYVDTFMKVDAKEEVVFLEEEEDDEDFDF